MLYALSQVSCNFYSIDAITRDVKLVGKLKIDGQDVSGLAYDPTSDALLTLVLHFDSSFNNPRSDLARVNADNARVTSVGKVADGLFESLCWREVERTALIKATFVRTRLSGSWQLERSTGTRPICTETTGSKSLGARFHEKAVKLFLKFISHFSRQGGGIVLPSGLGYVGPCFDP
jgi:hypothetical protein